MLILNAIKLLLSTSNTVSFKFVDGDAFNQYSCALLIIKSVEFNAKYAVVTDEASAKQLSQIIKDLKGQTEVLFGEQALCDVASSSQVQVVMAAIVGAAGLLPTLSAVESSKKVLLANKESLVMAGSIFMHAVQQHSANLLPIDSDRILSSIKLRMVNPFSFPLIFKTISF